jgi:Protein of unknown function (DUF3592)/Mu transposase, C-terminal
MSAVVGIWIAVAGLPAMLAGLGGIQRVRRLRHGGVKAWALAVPEPAADGNRRVGLQYTLADGNVLERLAPPTARKAAALRPGQQVLIWYDPADPQDILVYGREGRVSDLMFVLAGAMFLLAGAGIAAFAP